MTYVTPRTANVNAIKVETKIIPIIGLNILGIILLFNPMMGMIFVSTLIAFTFAVLGVTYVIDGLALYSVY
jgi:uncharacterized membrane protein HdeD (DUF308 family)